MRRPGPKGYGQAVPGLFSQFFPHPPAQHQAAGTLRLPVQPSGQRAALHQHGNGACSKLLGNLRGNGQNPPFPSCGKEGGGKSIDPFHGSVSPPEGGSDEAPAVFDSLPCFLPNSRERARSGPRGKMLRFILFLFTIFLKPAVIISLIRLPGGSSGGVEKKAVEVCSIGCSV